MVFLKQFWFFGLFLIPIALNLGELGGNPVEFLIADFVLIVSLIALSFKRLNAGTIYWADLKLYFIFIYYCFFISIASSIYFESILPIVGQLRFVKSTFIFLIAYYLTVEYEISLEKLINYLSYSFAVILFLLISSDIIFNPAFPLGRWGGNILDFHVYGFPNAAAGYYAILSSILFYTLDREKNLIIKCIVFAAVILTAIVCIFSLSRNAFFTYVVSCILCGLYILNNYRLKFLFICMFTGFVFIITPYILMNEALMHKLILTKSENALSGRGGVWLFAQDVILSSPLFGYGFYSFSNLGYEIGTLHNFFLDIIYKSGVVGFGLYLAALFLPILSYFKLPLSWRKRYTKEIKLYMIILVLCFISGLTQESLSYSMNQLVVFYLSGIILAAFRRSDN